MFLLENGLCEVHEYQEPNYAVVKSVLIHLNHQCLKVGAGWCPSGAATADAAPENGVSVI